MPTMRAPSRPTHPLRTPWWLAVTLVLALGCASARPEQPAPPAAPAPPAPAVASPASGTEDLWLLYAEAIDAARYPTEDRVARDLVPILRSTSGLRWNEAGQVLMVTWTKRKYYQDHLHGAYVVPEKVYVWLTAAPFLQRFCQRLGLGPDELRLRLAQLLGMPPDASNDAFVEMWIDPRSFFRPCPDPEINDRECQVSLTVGAADPAAPCPWQAALEGQVSGAFVAVAPGHLSWMCQNWQGSYTGEPATSYPWTALGYTYDWGDPKDPVGQSEYVAPPGATAWIESITATADYCRPPAAAPDAGGGPRY